MCGGGNGMSSRSLLGNHWASAAVKFVIYAMNVLVLLQWDSNCSSLHLHNLLRHNKSLTISQNRLRKWCRSMWYVSLSRMTTTRGLLNWLSYCFSFTHRHPIVDDNPYPNFQLLLIVVPSDRCMLS